MKTKYRPMRMQWVMLVFTIAVAATNWSNTVWQWVACAMTALVTGGLFVSSWYQTNNYLEELEIEYDKFQAEKDETVKGLTYDGYMPAKEGIRIVYGRSGTLFVLCNGQIEKMGSTVQITTKETVKIVSFENYVALMRIDDISSESVFVKG